MKKIIFLILLFSLIAIGAASDEARLLRYPDINGDLVAFVYAGDIWTVPAKGGEAKRLTSHKGLELFPKISPDKKWIAFSAEYSGSRQVYIIPTTGGNPKQLTYYNDAGAMPPRGGYDHVVLDWSPDSRKIMVRCNRTPFGRRKGKYFMVNIAGGLETPLPIPEGGFGSLSPDGKNVCFVQIGREFRTWKRYKGGMAADIWLYDLEKNNSRQITTFKGTDHHPSWYKNKIYFASDQNLILNMYSYDLATGKTEALTNHTEYDVMWPSGGNGMLVYENGGYLYILNLESGKEEKMTVYLHFDNPHIRAYHKNVSGNINNYDISPTGKRAVFDARGDIFTVPAKKGEIENLTQTQGIREISPRWSPDKKHIAYYSDATGEYEIYLIDKDGTTSPRQLTKNSSAWKYPAVWSPDSKKLLFSDKKQLLQILDIQSGKITAVDRASAYDIEYYRWSHDSKWIVYTKNGQNKQDAVWVYSLQEGKPHQLTNDTFIDFNPVFSTCGQYIFFLSNRDFNLTQSSFENDFLYCKATKIFALPLKKDTTPLFIDRNDTEDLLEQASPKSGKSTKGVKGNHGIAIDYKDCDRRIQAFPIANVGTLYPSPTTDLFSYLDAIDGGIIYSRDKQLFRFTFEGKKEEKILEHIDELLLSANKKKLLYKRGAQFCIVDLLPNRGSGSGVLNLAKLTMRLEPLKEWQQIYNDGWRIFRDWFYAENMHGVDWLKIRKKYQALVPHVGHRADLDYIFGELIGESNTGHCYANYGEFERVKRVDTGLLGADLKADEKAGRYKITKIYKGENWNPLRRSPLTQPGINIQEGAYIISLNKHNLTLTDNPYRFLENTVGKRIPITVNSLPKKEGARTYMIKPIASELELFYHDWAESRRAMVDRLSGGKIGYIHLPNTAIKGTRELYRGMYAYFNKQALIIDDRYNGGGFIPQVAIGLLSRTTFNYWARRGVENFKSPEIAHDGLKAMLCNGYSSSGGDALPYYFRKRKLGPIIGTRTWGGLVGLTSNAAFADGGSFNVPTFGFYDNGKWEVEGLGVTPDIKVVDEPHLLAAGKDPCIEKAVEVLMKKLNANPPKPIKDPPLPDRSKWHEEELN